MKKVLAAIAILPLACTKPSETPPQSDASIARDPIVPASSFTAGMSPPMSAVTSASASASSTAVPSRRQACEALQQKVATLLGNRACATTADCDNVMTGCGLDGQCGAPIAKTRKPDVEKTSALFYSKNCLDVLAPQACATCPMPPTPKCVNGQCN